MFLVSDSLAQRQSRICEFKGQDASIGAVLAAIDLEWTIRRAILALGTSPNKVIRDDVLANCHGLGRYKEAWGAEVKPRFNKTLPTVLGARKRDKYI